MNSNIFGIKINTNINKKFVLTEIEKAITKKDPCLVCTTNSEFIVDALDDPQFKKIINTSLLSVPDGIGVLMATRYLQEIAKIEKDVMPLIIFLRKLLIGLKIGFVGLKNPQKLGYRIPGIELMQDMCELAAERNYNIFILGGWPKDKLGRPLKENTDIATTTAQTLKNKYPNLNIVGSSSAFSYKEEDDIATLDYIHSCMQKVGVTSIDMIFVAYNHINQEKWLTRNMKKIPAYVGMGVGGSLDFISGYQQRAPYFIQKISLEWLYRLYKEPWRYRRILKAFPYFPYLVFKRSLLYTRK